MSSNWIYASEVSSYCQSEFSESDDETDADNDYDVDDDDDDMRNLRLRDLRRFSELKYSSLDM